MKYQRSTKRLFIIFSLLFILVLWRFSYDNNDDLNADYNIEQPIHIQQQSQIVPQKNQTYTSPITLSYNWPQFKTWKQDNWYFPQQKLKLINDNTNEYLQGLQTYTTNGHSYEQLISLSKTIDLTPTLDLTIVIYLDGEMSQLTSYVDLISRQTVTPKYIWILYTSSSTKVSQPFLESYIKTIPIPSKIIDISMYTKNINNPIDNSDNLNNNNNNNQWLTVLQSIPTTYLWLLDIKLDHQMKLIANNELEYIFRTVQLKDYQNALVGIDGILLPSNMNKDSTRPQFVCLPSDDLPKVTQPVDLFHDAWLLKKEWLSYMITFINSNPSSTNQQLPLGYHISQSLLRYGNIPSIHLPPPSSSSSSTDTLSRYSYRLSCNAIRNQYNNNKAWIQHRMLHTSPTALDFRQITIGRQRDDISTTTTTAIATNTTSSSLPLVSSWGHNVFYIIHGPQQAKAFYPLLCQRQQYPVHVIVTGVNHGVSGELFNSALNSINDCLGKNMILVHDLDLPAQQHQHEQLIAMKMVDEILRLSYVLRPDVILHLFPSQSSFYKSLQLAESIENNDWILIGLPEKEVDHVLWIPDLPLPALKSWNKISIQLVTITDRRPHSFSRLLQTCSNSYFVGDKVELVINMEQSADKVTMSLVNDYQWDYGKKIIRHRIQKGGLMPAIIESWYPKHDDEYAVLLEDDISLSPLFYVWAKYNILKYRYGHQSELNKYVYGISLYSPKNVELHRVGRRPFDPNEVLYNTTYPARTPYLSQIPCSWGAVYFPEHWREFHSFLTTQLDDLDHFQYLNISLPMSRSDRWKKSWKKYFIQLVYLRGYVMIYPNFQDFESFSTNHLETGTHVKSEKRIKIIQTFQVPLMQRDTLLSQLPQHHLPELNQLPVLDLWGKLINFGLMDRRAESWHYRVSACKRKIGTFNPNDLLCPFTLIPIWDRPGFSLPKKKIKPITVTEVVEPIYYQTVTLASPTQQQQNNNINEDGSDDNNTDISWPISIDVSLLSPPIDDFLVGMDDEEKDLRQNWNSLKRFLQN
ncbi:hypothetical protein BJ944DRAFT_269137 [Cunninghamella echinulata]|nr:hypothetical protein BJ944DRAFT_269137 [Cunninghamella echinulata]